MPETGTKKMSRNRRILLQMAVENGRKIMMWAPPIALLAVSTEGKIIPIIVWEAMIPLAIVAGLTWYWAMTQLPNND